MDHSINEELQGKLKWMLMSMVDMDWIQLTSNVASKNLPIFWGEFWYWDKNLLQKNYVSVWWGFEPWAWWFGMRVLTWSCYGGSGTRYVLYYVYFIVIDSDEFNDGCGRNLVVSVNEVQVWTWRVRFNPNFSVYKLLYAEYAVMVAAFKCRPQPTFTWLTLLFMHSEKYGLLVTY